MGLLGSGLIGYHLQEHTLLILTSRNQHKRQVIDNELQGTVSA
jgi:hypothetical protein